MSTAFPVADKFAPVGFSEKAFVACYGMAESTLAISFSKLGAGVVTDVVDGEKLWAEGQARALREAGHAGTRVFISRDRGGPR